MKADNESGWYLPFNKGMGMRDQSLTLEAQLLRLAPRVRRFALVLTQGSADAADEIVAATFDCAWRAGRRLGAQHTRLDFWLFSEVISVWRRDFPIAARIEPLSASTAPSIAAARTAISSLPSDERLIIGLMVIERMNAEQAAAVLEITPQRAAQIHARARRNLDLALGAGRRAEGAA